MATTSTGSAATIDRFIDALWIEDGLAANTPAQFAAQIAAEYEVYKKVVAAQKLTLE